MEKVVLNQEKFGHLLGWAPGDVPAYSSNYDLVDEKEYPTRHSFHSYLDGIYMGYKWQCVEFARRWLYMNKGLTFDSVANAADIFELTSFRRTSNGELLPIYSFKNGSSRRPEAGSFLIWEKGGEFEGTGHVAIVTEVSDAYIRIAEQNVSHKNWAQGRDYSRELKVQIDEDGGYWIECQFAGSALRGWVIQTKDSKGAESFHEPDCRLLQIKPKRVQDSRQKSNKWLNIANADEAAFVKAMGSHSLTDNIADRNKYFVISEQARDELVHATEELHHMFMYATDYVLENRQLLAKFSLPEVLWPRIKQSWDNRRNEMISGRFDFALSERGLKVYEYNSDSASCHMECGKVQGLWAKNHGCREGYCAGDRLTQKMVKAWREAEVDETLFIMLDDNPEETYHALYMRLAMEAAGLKCKIIKGVDGLKKDTDGQVYDSDGEKINWVWKTWAWETALDQLKEACEVSDSQKEHTINLADVLLRPEVMVYEPLWTLVPSNKSILPVLWELYPNHPFLLESHFELTDSLKKKGYVVKPIVGRCGDNIQLYSKGNELLHATEGQFSHKDDIYQELFRLPIIDSDHVQMNTFTVAGRYAGACVRLDMSPIITSESDILPLRVVSNEKYLDY